MSEPKDNHAPVRFIAHDRAAHAETRIAGFRWPDGRIDVRIVRYYVNGALVGARGGPGARSQQKPR